MRLGSLTGNSPPRAGHVTVALYTCSDSAAAAADGPRSASTSPSAVASSADACANVATGCRFQQHLPWRLGKWKGRVMDAVCQ